MIVSTLADLRVSIKRMNNWTIPGLLVTLAALIIYTHVRSPFFFSINNFLNIGSAIAIRGLIAIGLTILLISGGIDLSVAAVAAVSGMVAALLINSGVPGNAAALIALVAAMVMGVINAFIIVRLRVNPIIGTLGTLLMFRGLGFVVSSGDNIVIGVDAWSVLGRGKVQSIPVSLIVFLSILVVGILFMRYTTVGNYLYAIGGNSEACRNVGVKVDRLRSGSYVATAVLSGLAGVTIMSQGGTAQPIALNGAELEIITAVFLGGVALTGGRGSLFGTLLGIIIIGVITNSFILTQVQVYWQRVVLGFILIVAVSLDSVRRGGGYR